MGQLGSLIGQGATAEIFAWGDGTVVKLFRPEYGDGLGPVEVAKTRAAHACGAPAPAVLDEVMIGGRYGAVLPRLDGPTLFDCLTVGAIEPEAAGEILAGLYHQTHACTGGPEMQTCAQWIEVVLHAFSGNLSAELLALTRERAAALPSADSVCHGDLHVQNVLMTSAGARPIDWMSVVRAPFAWDVARCHLTLGHILPPEHEVIGKGIHRGFLRAYSAGVGLAEATLLKEVAPFMPVVAGMRLAEPSAAPFERPILEALLRG